MSDPSPIPTAADDRFRRFPGAVRACVVLAALVIGLSAACGEVGEDVPGAAPSQGVDFATATQVMESHGQEIRRRYRGVTGMEITTTSGAEALPKDRRFVIGVYLKSEEDVPEGAQSIAGVPLTFIVTGVVTPQPAPSGG